MIWLRFWRWLCGWVQFQAEGGGAGRLLTLAAREGLALWNTNLHNATLFACCKARDYRRLRPLARRCGMRLHLQHRHGAVFFLRRYHARPGLVAGAALYAVLLLLLTGRIWSVDIRGVSHADEHALRALLADHGVAVGQRRAVVDPEAIQLAALQQRDDISWLAVNLDGCIAEIEVKEMSTEETPPEATAPSNLVAARDGLIVAMEITGGEATVQVGDAVAEGGLLVSGITATDRETLLRRAAGVVLAQTEHHLTVEIPMEERLLLPCADAHETLELRVFGLLLPLFDNNLSSDGCRVEESDRLLTVGGVTLPLGLRMRRYTPLSEQTVIRTVEEAEALAAERLATEEETTLADVNVIERTVEKTVSDNTLILTANYRCVENIAREIPLQLEEPNAPESKN